MSPCSTKNSSKADTQPSHTMGLGLGLGCAIGLWAFAPSRSWLLGASIDYSFQSQLHVDVELQVHNRQEARRLD